MFMYVFVCHYFFAVFVVNVITQRNVSTKWEETAQHPKHPSFNTGEGWGRPHVEAMSMELPVIATNWSGSTATRR